jgi:hypothetical protein
MSSALSLCCGDSIHYYFVEAVFFVSSHDSVKTTPNAAKVKKKWLMSSLDLEEEQFRTDRAI